MFIFLPVGFDKDPDLSRLRDFRISKASSAGCDPSEE